MSSAEERKRAHNLDEQDDVGREAKVQKSGEHDREHEAAVSLSIGADAHNAKRKKKKKHKKGKGGAVTGDRSIIGEDAKPELHPKLDELKRTQGLSHLLLRHVQELVLWAIGDGKMPQWVFLKNKSLVEKVAVVLVDGVSASAYARNGSACTNLPSLFPAAIPIQFPGDRLRVADPNYSLLTVGLPKKEMARRLADDSKDHSKEFPSSCYCLTPEQLSANGYPAWFPGWTGEFEGTGVTIPNMSGYKPSSPHKSNPQAAGNLPMFAVDCEMVVTEVGHELARVSILDAEDGKVLMDEFVLPAHPVKDYLTRWSGITPENLANITVTLEDVQERIRALLPPNAILVGHSLESDLKALKLVHDRVIDTALLYPHPAGGPYKNSLKSLAERFLNRPIQQGDGHDSIEDARACLDLVKLKLRRGPSFGTSESVTQSIFRRLRVACNKAGAMIDAPEMLSGHSDALGVPWKTDREAVEKLKAFAQRDIAFLFTRLYGTSSDDDSQLSEQLREVDRHIGEIHHAMKGDNTVLVVVCGPGRILNLTAHLPLFSRVSGGQPVADARQGFLFMTVP